ncbi:LVIVD repeat-containing protein [Salipaludibacillus aurantiacus]|uniref:Uncharacterized conserved protein n=1 Tax=Salipaludibacillus aurantiacus TaxID=1601833 RepID=A0A1H9VYK0_9BACI|nr:hypothetical protein [Salipaludibacillus aurantiacus]SES26836.1 Uncharacterized conserved protein [Salipaludibacillus aurantiacus]
MKNKLKMYSVTTMAALVFATPVMACDIDGLGKGDYEYEDGSSYRFGDEGMNEIPVMEGSKNFKYLNESAAVPLEASDSGLPVTGADVYAHKGYAYMGTHRLGSGSNEGIRVFNMKDPSNPVEVAKFADNLPGTWQEKIIVKSVNTPHFKGDLAVVSVQRFNGDAEKVGTVIYDVTNPEKPVELGFWETPEAHLNGGGTHELYLTTQGNRALLLAANSGSYRRSGGAIHDFTIVDVSNPAEPEELFQFDPATVIPNVDNNYRFVDEHGQSRSISVHSVIADTTGKYAYLSAWDMGTVILDISNPEDPEYVGRTSFEKDVQGAAHSAALAKGENVLIETREVFNPTRHGYEQGFGYVRIYDIKDKSDPKLLSNFQTDNAANKTTGYPGFTVHDPKVQGNTLFLSHYFDGVRVVDITDPSAPEEIGAYVPEKANIWGVFAHRNYILASDMESGLKVLQKNNKIK